MTISQAARDAAALAKAGKLPCPHCDGTGAVTAEQLGFGGMIVTARKLSGMSQQQLADEVGITRAQIAAIETGRSSIPLESVRKYASALNINVADLIP